MHKDTVALAAWVLIVPFLACGRPVDSNCTKACNAQNGCPGNSQTNCSSLCGAVPRDCTSETPAYWNCAAAHLNEACQSFPSCSSEFSSFAACVEISCLAYPTDPNCYYVSTQGADGG